ncbi:MAG: hypothetical protein ACJ763_05800 [Bdellovibrionia bacterium]
MQRIRTQNQFVSRIGAGAFALFLLHSAHASVPNLRPTWSHRSQVTEAPNCSYLNDTNHAADPLFLNHLVDQKTVLNLNQQYQDMNRDYELKQKYGLVDMNQEQNHGSDLSHFGKQAFAEVRKYQANREAKRLKKAVDREESLKAFMKPAAIVGAGAAIYSGTPVNLEIDEDTRFRAVANGPSQTGQFSLLSNMGTTSLDFDLNKPDPNKAYTADPRGQIERYRLSFSRGLPLWDLTSGVYYGGSTTSVGASISKSLMPHLTAVIDSVRPLQQGRYFSEESLRFFYGLTF